MDFQIIQCLIQKELYNKENLDKNNLEKVKNNFRKIFRVPVIEPLSDGASEIADYLEKLNEK